MHNWTYAGRGSSSEEIFYLAILEIQCVSSVRRSCATTLDTLPLDFITVQCLLYRGAIKLWASTAEGSGDCSRITSVTSRTAMYGPVRTVVWQGRQVTAAPMPIKSPSRELSMAEDYSCVTGKHGSWAQRSGPAQSSDAYAHLTDIHAVMGA